jgi:hypothetical protein
MWRGKADKISPPSSCCDDSSFKASVQPLLAFILGKGTSPKMKPDPSVLLIALAAGTPKVNPLGPIEPLHLDSGIARDSVSL